MPGLLSPPRLHLLPLLLVLLLLQPQRIDGRLLLVQTLTRHGTRAPNPDVTRACPSLFSDTTQIIDAFGAAPGHLTSRGVEMMRDVGVWMRQVYVEDLGFVKSTYSRWANLWSFRAIQKSRHLVSAASISQGIFPDQPVAVLSSPAVEDDLLASPPAACAAETRARALSWLDAHGPSFFAHPNRSRVVQRMETICATPGARRPMSPAAVLAVLDAQAATAKAEAKAKAKTRAEDDDEDDRRKQGKGSKSSSTWTSSSYSSSSWSSTPSVPPIPGNPHPEFQDVCDLFSFMQAQRVQLPASASVSSAVREAVSSPALVTDCMLISVAAMTQRLFQDPATTARFCGRFPHWLGASFVDYLEHLKLVAAARRQDPDLDEQPRMFVSVASRELLYALTHFYGITVKAPDRPDGFIMAGTTLVWELGVHEQNEQEANEHTEEKTSLIPPRTIEEVLLAMPKDEVQTFLSVDNAYIRAYYHYPGMPPAARVQVQIGACVPSEKTQGQGQHTSTTGSSGSRNRTTSSKELPYDDRLDCPLADFLAIGERSARALGTFSELCPREGTRNAAIVDNKKEASRLFCRACRARAHECPADEVEAKAEAEAEAEGAKKRSEKMSRGIGSGIGAVERDPNVHRVLVYLLGFLVAGLLVYSMCCTCFCRGAKGQKKRGKRRRAVVGDDGDEDDERRRRDEFRRVRIPTTGDRIKAETYSTFVQPRRGGV